MKRFFALAALVLGLAACQTEPEGLDVNVGGEVDTTITVTLPDSETRANSAVGAFANLDLKNSDLTIRYILQVYYGETAAPKQFAYSDETHVTFDVRLVPGRDYKFVVWADVVDGTNAVDGVDVGDNHYNTEYLTAITFKGDWNAMDETFDAFTGVFDTATKLTDGYTGTSSINIPLTRPFAKLRVLTTDMVELGNLGIVPEGVKVKYTVPVYNSFNALNGAVNNTTVVDKVFEYNLTDDDVEKYEATQTTKTLFTNYLFGADNGVIKFEMSVYDNTNAKELIKFNNFSTDIPVQRNYLTTIQGDILTDGNKIEVNVTDEFANAGSSTDAPYYQETISSVAELLTAINANNGEYILISDLDVNGITTSALAATRSTGNGTTINLNGYTITLKTDITIAEGNTLTINDINENGETGAIVSKGGQLVNNGTLNIEGGEFGENTIENNNGEVNITGGEFSYNPENEIPDGYKVVETENGKYEVRVGDPIAKIGDVEYTTIQAAIEAAEGETTINLTADVTLKNTVVIAEGKTVTLNLNGKTLAHADEANKYALNNLGTLTITGNGTINARGIYNGYGNGGENVATAKLTIENGTFNAKGENGGAAVYNYGEANINGGSFTSIGGYSLNNQSGSSMTIADGVNANNGVYTSNATLTINGGEISGNRSGCHVIYCWNANITIYGGTFYNNNSGNATVMAAGTTTITYNGGNYGIKDGRVPGNGNTWTSCLLDSANSATAVINDGTYNGGFRVQAGTSMTINGGSFNDCYGSNYNIYGTVTVKGGTYTDAAAIAFAEKYVANGYMAVDNGDNTSTVIMPAAKVGSTIYTSIDEAIAAWTNNTTLTLMSDVTLSDVITLKSTEHHILNLSTFTMTAASGKNAIEITPFGDGAGTAAKSCLTINADANNPGQIAAGNKACIYYKKTNGINDRIMVTINGGVFDGTISSSSNNGGQACPYFVFNGGVFNKSINLTKAMLKVTDGTFHGMFSCTGDSTAHRLISGGTFKSWTFMTADAANKFCVGTDKQTYNVGVYVNDEGYLVVGGPVITEFGDKFAAKATNATKWSSYLKYSSAAANGLYYTNAEMAIEKHGAANVELAE